MLHAAVRSRLGEICGLALLVPFSLLGPPLAATAQAPGKVPPEAAASNAQAQALALESALRDLGLSPECQPEAGVPRCRFAVRSSLTERGSSAIARYVERTQMLHVYVPRVLTAPAEGRATPALLQHLMELNWTLSLTKFAWNPRDGEVRLGAALSTNAEFDRKALWSLIHQLDLTMATHAHALQTLQQNLETGSEAPGDVRAIGKARPKVAPGNARGIREAVDR